MPSKCKLCGSVDELRESHILPAFACDWLKTTAVSGIRSGLNPNQRIQDGPKPRLLCDTCEQRFSRDEKVFAERIFTPVHEDGLTTDFSYGEWACRFAVSISWRVLVYNLELAPLDHFSEKQRKEACTAELQWRRFLLGEAKHPDRYEQHLVILDMIGSHSTPGLSPFINRYITRAIDMDVIAARHSSMTYAKLGKVVVFGLLDTRGSKEWKGTRLHVKRGSLNARRVRIPGGLLPYLNDKADRTQRSLESISDRQRTKVDASIWKSPERVANSLAFEAMIRDVELSGEAAFRKTPSNKTPPK
jgi:hypothetical protein